MLLCLCNVALVYLYRYRPEPYRYRPELPVLDFGHRVYTGVYSTEHMTTVLIIMIVLVGISKRSGQYVSHYMYRNS